MRYFRSCQNCISNISRKSDGPDEREDNMEVNECKSRANKTRSERGKLLHCGEKCSKIGIMQINMKISVDVYRKMLFM